MIKISADKLPQDHQFNGIDVVKFICAFLVCLLHIKPFTGAPPKIDSMNFWIQNFPGRIAVPFYFVSSGFLLYKKTELDDLNVDRIKSYCLKTLRLLGTWSFLLFAVGSPQYQLWYLRGLVLAVIVLSFLFRKGVPLSVTVIISVALYALGMLGDAYYSFLLPLRENTVINTIMYEYEDIFTNTRNGLFFGVIFVLMGALFAKKQIKINNIAAIAGFVLSMLALLAEIILLRKYSHPKNYNMLISLVPATFFLFYIASHIELKSKPVYRKLRVIGMTMFFTHLFVNLYVRKAVTLLNSVAGVKSVSLQFVLTICLTFLLSAAVEKLSEKNKFKWLRYLFS